MIDAALNVAETDMMNELIIVCAILSMATRRDNLFTESSLERRQKYRGTTRCGIVSALRTPRVNKS